MDFAYLGSVALLVFGFGFVIFWHELGHFLAAKWAGVRVEQFAVGFGQALLSWRKGLGTRWGSSRSEYEKKLHEYLRQNETALHSDSEYTEKATSEELRLDYAAKKLGISETEYRLNWIPLGGYVKMLGQDDMNPNALSDSPHAYNNKPISKRMVIVSAGVIMNIILAIILFTVLFRFGFDVPPPVVGMVLPDSPAQQAGIQVGDRVLSFDGREQHDYAKIQMNVALASEGEPIQVLVQRPNGTKATLAVTPRKTDLGGGLLQMGINSSRELAGIDSKLVTDDVKSLIADSPVHPDEKIVAIEGKPVGLKDYYVLDDAVQSGKPVTVTVEDPKGQRSDRTISGFFLEPFGNAPFNIAGMMPRTRIEALEPASPAKDKLKPGDIITEVVLQPTNDPTLHPARAKLMKLLNSAYQNNLKVDMFVLREGSDKPVEVKGLDPTMSLGEGRHGLGIALRLDEEHPVIAEVLPDSAAASAQIPAGSIITSIGGQPVKDWHDMQRMIAGASTDQPLSIAAITPEGETKTFQLKLTAEQLKEVRANRYVPDVLLKELSEPRKTTNPILAAKWGVAETRDLLLQFYVTIRRMTQGSVSPSNMMGPLGIFHQGSKIANRGNDWLVWFLAMISANLAVVNFLPIPIVDGGLFVFLILEKVMGKPLSPRAQSVAQLVGLALIAGVFLFVTYHDIVRLM
jgi:regulator of sigma E protease